MARLDVALGLFWVLLALALGWQSALLGLGGPDGPGSGLFPLLAAALIGAGGAGVALRGGRAAPGEERAARFWEEPGAPRRVAALLAVASAMVLAVPHLGFALAGALGLPLLHRAIAPGSRWWASVLLGLVAAAGVHLLFAVLLGTPLPRGPLGF